MAISFNAVAGAAGSSSAAQVASQTLTIPAGVLAGDWMILVVSAFSNAAPFTPTVASTGTAFAQVPGTGTQTGGNSTGFLEFGQVWAAKATALDPGATITASGGTAFYALALAAYTGADPAAPFDVAQGNAIVNSAVLSISTPSLTTTIAADWGIQCCAFGVTNPPASGPATSRIISASGTAGQVGAAIADTAGSAGGAGSPIGGGTFTAGAGPDWWTSFTIGLAPPHSAPGGYTSLALGYHRRIIAVPALSQVQGSAGVWTGANAT